MKYQNNYDVLNALRSDVSGPFGAKQFANSENQIEEISNFIFQIFFIFWIEFLNLFENYNDRESLFIRLQNGQ